MPTKREREYYRMGFTDGYKEREGQTTIGPLSSNIERAERRRMTRFQPLGDKPKRKLSAWNKFVKANSKKKIYQYASGKLKLKKMGIAFRKKRR